MAARKPAAKKPTAKITGYKFKGGAHIHGVPASDLTPAQYKQYQDVIEGQQKLINMVLYEPVMDSAAKEEE